MQTWFKFDDEHDEEPSHTANVHPLDHGGALVEWWNEAVGLVTTIYHNTLADAEKRLSESGYQDFTA